MKLRNKKTGEIWDIGKVLTCDYPSYETLEQINEEWEDYNPKEPLIKDEKIRKAVRAWAEVLEIDEVEFYGDAAWIGLRTNNSGARWQSKFELDYFGSKNTLVTFRTYTITELCGEEEG